jgi:hypothetical protein
VEHRRLEQMLVLLASDSGVSRETLRQCVDELAAHLGAEEAVLYPRIEREWDRPVGELRQLQGRMRLLLARITSPSLAESLRAAYLRELDAAFREHARIEEGVALPWLQATMNAASLEELGRRLRDFRAARLSPAQKAAKQSAENSARRKRV